jgi:hypothetical protein
VLHQQRAQRQHPDGEQDHQAGPQDGGLLDHRKPALTERSPVGQRPGGFLLDRQEEAGR